MRRAGVICLMIFLAGLVNPPDPAAERRPVPAPAAVVMNKARHLLAEGKINESIDLLKSFQAKREDISPAAADARGYTHYLVDFMLGNCHLMLEDPAAAVRYYQAVVGQQPDFIEARFNLARGLYDLGRPAEAGQAFVAAYETSGGHDPGTLYYGAVCFMQAQDYKRALSVLERLLESHPQELPADWRQTLTRIYLALEMPDRALPHVEILADQTEGSRQREWRETLVYLYLQLQLKEKALARARTFTRDDPLEPKWWKTCAWLLLQQQDYRRALTSLTALSYLQPLSDEERVLLGDVNFMAGIPVEAVRNYEKELTQKVETGLVKKTAQGYLRLYDEQRALAWIERGLKAVPADQDLLALKGYLLYQNDRLEEAAAVYARLTDISPQSGQNWLMRGYIAWRRGDIAAARDAFSHAEDSGRFADQARKALTQLR